jgi:hypothetical protein
LCRFAENEVEQQKNHSSKWNNSKSVTRVARWHIFKQKNFGGSCNGICWYFKWPFGLVYGNLVYFVALW